MAGSHAHAVGHPASCRHRAGQRATGSTKFDPAYRDGITRRYLALSRQVIGSGARLVIWPESSTPFFFKIDSALAQPIRQLAIETRTPFIIGTDDLVPATATVPQHIYNASVALGADGQTHGEYRKMYLAPFGEYVPFKTILFFVGPLVDAVSDFTPGLEATVLDTGVGSVSTNICYESVYPWLSRAFVANGSQLLGGHHQRRLVRRRRRRPRSTSNRARFARSSKAAMSCAQPTPASVAWSIRTAAC